MNKVLYADSENSKKTIYIKKAYKMNYKIAKGESRRTLPKKLQ